jgi:hypothetical protein
MIPELFRLSPRRVDPLSWYTRPLIPLLFGIVGAVLGVGSVLVYWPAIHLPVLDLVAVLVSALACVYVQARSRSIRRAIDSVDGAVALAIATVGLGISSYANVDSTIGIQFWWAPVGVGVVIAALAPYSSILQLAAYSAAMLVACTSASLLGFLSPPHWPPLSTAVIGGVNIVIAFAACTTFVGLIVKRTLDMLTAGEQRADEAAERREAIAEVERHTVARLGARVSPFLERVADSGVVTDADRALAGQLARRLRSDLLERTDRNWLESLSDVGRIFVVDPEHRADRLNNAQRAALRGLVTTVLASPGTDTGSLFLELRARDSGTTAVALSFDVELPDGRRSRLIAPFYLALQSSVTDLRWDRARGMVTFEVQ